MCRPGVVAGLTKASPMLVMRSPAAARGFVVDAVNRPVIIWQAGLAGAAGLAGGEVWELHDDTL